MEKKTFFNKSFKVILGNFALLAMIVFTSVNVNAQSNALSDYPHIKKMENAQVKTATEAPKKQGDARKATPRGLAQAPNVTSTSMPQAMTVDTEAKQIMTILDKSSVKLPVKRVNELKEELKTLLNKGELSTAIANKAKALVE